MVWFGFTFLLNENLLNIYESWPLFCTLDIKDEWGFRLFWKNLSLKRKTIIERTQSPIWGEGSVSNVPHTHEDLISDPEPIGVPLLRKNRLQGSPASQSC